MSLHEQLALNLRLNEAAQFENFYVTPKNRILVEYLKNFLAQSLDSFVYIWGASQQGKSHLLQAVCHLAHEKKIGFFYFSLRLLNQIKPDLLQNLESYELVAIDDIDPIIGDPQWEEMLFYLYNKSQAQKKYLLITSSSPPNQLPFKLADLKSRINTATVFHLTSLNDDEKIKVLQHEAQKKGLQLPEGSAIFLLKNFVRDLPNLLELLNQLDRASLINQRKLTVPFIKSILK